MKSLVTSLSVLLSIYATSALAEQTRENGGRRAPLAVKITFTSRGGGIDSVLKTSIDSTVQEYRDARLVRKYVEVMEGREGEITLCVQLTDFQTAYVFRNKVIDMIGQNNDLTTAEARLSCDDQDIIRPNE